MTRFGDDPKKKKVPLMPVGVRRKPPSPSRTPRTVSPSPLIPLPKDAVTKPITPTGRVTKPITPSGRESSLTPLPKNTITKPMLNKKS